MKHHIPSTRSAGLRPGAVQTCENAGSETGAPPFVSSCRYKVSKLWRLSLIGGLVTLAGLSSGCTNVKPWDRDTLAHYSMRPDRDPVTLSLREHMWFSREASNGGRSVGGGGCGCN